MDHDMSDQPASSTAAVRHEPLPSKAPWYKNRTLRAAISVLAAFILGIMIGRGAAAPATACQATYDQQSTVFSDYRNATSDYLGAVHDYFVDQDGSALTEATNTVTDNYTYLARQMDKIDPASCK